MAGLIRRAPPPRHYSAKVKALVEAALDQPHPSPALVAALNDVLTAIGHAEREAARDPRLGRVVFGDAGQRVIVEPL